MHYTFCNNNPLARITVREVTEHKLNILLEWPNEIRNVGLDSGAFLLMTELFEPAQSNGSNWTCALALVGMLIGDN